MRHLIAFPIALKQHLKRSPALCEKREAKAKARGRPRPEGEAEGRRPQRTPFERERERSLFLLAFVFIALFSFASCLLSFAVRGCLRVSTKKVQGPRRSRGPSGRLFLF